MAQYRSSLDEGATPAIVAKWITETEAKKALAETRLPDLTGSTPKRMTREEITALVSTLGNLLKILHRADPADKAQIYEQLGVQLTYDPSPKNSDRPSRTAGRSCT